MRGFNSANRSMVLAATAMSALAVSSFAREITGFSVDAENMTATVVLGEAAADGETNAVYYVWSADGQDKGDGIASWPNVLKLGIVDETDEVRMFALAEEARPTAQCAARAFLATTSNDYDYLVEGVKSVGTAAATPATCYIDTGFCPVGNKTICTVDCLMNSTKGQQYIFGCNDAVDTSLSFCGYINGKKASGGKYAFSCNNGDGAWQMPTDLTVSSTERVVLTLDGTPANETGKATVKSTGVTYTKTYSRAHTQTSAVPMYLFARRQPAGNAGMQSLVTMYSCVITNDGVCVRDFRPAVRRGVAGMWDAAGGKFYASLGSDALVAVGTNETYFIEEGDVVLSTSPAWTQASGDYETDQLQVEPLSLTFSSGGTKRGAAPLVLTGENSWGGTFTVYEGSLIADFGQGLATTDALVLNGGNYGTLTGENVSWTPGADAAARTVSVAPQAPSFGFTAYGHPLAVAASGAPSSPIEFGAASSCGLNPSSLVLNDNWATDTLTFKNGIAGNNGDDTAPTLAVYTGAADAVIEGGLTNVSLTKEGAGTLRIHAATNTVGDLLPLEGGLVFAPPDGVATGVTTIASLSKATNLVSNVVFSNSTVSIGGAASWQGGTDVAFVNSAVAVAGNMAAGSGPGSKGKSGLLLDGSSISVGGGLFTYGHNGNNSASGTGDIVLTNSSTLTCLQLNGRNGTMRQYGGTVKATGDDIKSHNAFSIGNAGVGYNPLPAATYELHGGTIDITHSKGTFTLGECNSLYYGDGTMYVYDGGRVNFAGPEAFLGRYSNDKGRLYIRGGTVTMSKSGVIMYLTAAKKTSRAECEVSAGGVLDVNGSIIAGSLSSDGGHTVILSVLTNGTVKTRRISSPMTNDTMTAVLDGGTIFAKPSSSASFFYGFTSARVGVGGVVIDTNGQNLEVPQSFTERSGQEWRFGNAPADIVAAPAFTKAGEGVLTLTGTNSWLCGTCVSNGTLAVAEKALPETNLRLAGGVIDLCGLTHTVTNLVGSGTISNGTLVVVGRVWPGYGDNGKLVVAADATLSATNLSYSVDSDSGTCGTLVVKSPFDLSGATIDIDNQEATGCRGLVLVDGPVTGRPLSDPGVSISPGKVKFRAPGMILLIY